MGTIPRVSSTASLESKASPEASKGVPVSLTLSVERYRTGTVGIAQLGEEEFSKFRGCFPGRTFVMAADVLPGVPDVYVHVPYTFDGSAQAPFSNGLLRKVRGFCGEGEESSSPCSRPPSPADGGPGEVTITATATASKVDALTTTTLLFRNWGSSKDVSNKKPPTSIIGVSRPGIAVPSPGSLPVVFSPFENIFSLSTKIPPIVNSASELIGNNFIGLNEAELKETLSDYFAKTLTYLSNTDNRRAILLAMLEGSKHGFSNYYTLQLRDSEDNPFYVHFFWSRNTMGDERLNFAVAVETGIQGSRHRLSIGVPFNQNTKPFAITTAPIVGNSPYQRMVCEALSRWLSQENNGVVGVVRPFGVSMSDGYQHNFAVPLLYTDLNRSRAPNILGVGKQIADALAKLHEMGFAQVDIKPANIVFDPKNCNYFLCDTDSMISLRDGARRLEEFNPVLRVTPKYQAPEVAAAILPESARLKLELLPKADVFALTLMLVCLLTDKEPPWLGITREQTLAAILELNSETTSGPEIKAAFKSYFGITSFKDGSTVDESLVDVLLDYALNHSVFLGNNETHLLEINKGILATRCATRSRVEHDVKEMLSRIGPGLRELLGRGLAYDPEERCTAQDLAEGLIRILNLSTAAAGGAGSDS